MQTEMKCSSLTHTPKHTLFPSFALAVHRYPLASYFGAMYVHFYAVAHFSCKKIKILYIFIIYKNLRVRQNTLLFPHSLAWLNSSHSALLSRSAHSHISFLLSFGIFCSPITMLRSFRWLLSELYAWILRFFSFSFFQMKVQMNELAKVKEKKPLLPWFEVTCKHQAKWTQ